MLHFRATLQLGTQHLSKFLLPLVCYLILIAFTFTQNTASASALDFYDSFENTALDSFWNKFEAAGSVIFPSTTETHTGSQCVELRSIANAGQKNVEIYHEFPRPLYGKFSVWVFDTGADVVTANYLGFILKNKTGGSAAIVTQDYDAGSGNGGQYDYLVNGMHGISSIDRTKSWHQFCITATAETLLLEVDNHTIYSGSGGIKFDRVTLELHGPSWRPAWSYYFDDFRVTEEPQTDMGYIYWSTISNSKIKRARLDGTGIETVIANPSAGRFGGIAFDPAEGHLFTGDNQNIYRANLDGSECIVIASGT